MSIFLIPYLHTTNKQYETVNLYDPIVMVIKFSKLQTPLLPLSFYAIKIRAIKINLKTFPI